ncbi:MAG: response regulator [Armatimonadia bacterium]|nr:response regulator [Armatimonadia bacterium]
MDTGDVRVLVVDDEPYIREVCGRALQRAGYHVALAEDGAGAHEELGAAAFDAAILDINLPDTDGLQLLREVKEHNPDAVVVLITGFATLETAMEAVRLGAYEYVRKPFGAVDLVHIVERGLESQRLKGRNDELLQELQAANEDLLARQEQIRERMRIASDDLTAFVELGRRLSETSELPETLESIMRAGLQVTHARAAAAYRRDDAPPCLRGIMALGIADRDVVGVELPLRDGLLGTAATTAVARIENDLLNGSIADDEHLGFLGVQSVLVSPLTWGETVHGVLALYDNEDGGFSDESLNLVRVLSTQAARVVAAMEDVSAKPALPRDEDGFVDMADLL